MGIEYKHYALPRHGARPTFDRVLAFIRAAQRDRWIPDPASPGFAPPRGWATYHELAAESGAYVRIADGTEHAVPKEITLAWLEQHCTDDAIIGWHVDRLGGSGLRYPFLVNEMGDDAYFELELRFCPSFVYHTSEIIEPFSTVTCTCGKDLVVRTVYDFQAIIRGEMPKPDIFYGPRIPVRCSACDTPVDPERFKAKVNEQTAKGTKKRSVPGGCTYRFALAIDCNQGVPSRSELIRLQPDLVALAERELGVPCYEVGDFSL
jgi:hypothetical protein